MEYQNLLFFNKKLELNNKNITKNNRDKILELEVDHIAEELAELAAQERTSDGHQLSTIDDFKANKQIEYKEALMMNDICQSLNDAVLSLINEYQHFTRDELMDIINDFKNSNIKLSTLNTIDLTKKTIKELTQIKDSTLDLIEKLAKIKYFETDYKSCINFYILLSVLNPLNFDYWFHLGISYQEDNNFNNAINSYDKAIILNPMIITTYLFKAECFVKLGQKIEAVDEYEKAKELINNQNSQGTWKMNLDLLEKAIISL